MATNGPHVKKYFDLWAQMAYILGMKTELIKIRITPSEKEGFQAAADLAGLPLSAWVRERIRRAAIRELEEASIPIAFIKDSRK